MVHNNINNNNIFHNGDAEISDSKFKITSYQKVEGTRT